MLPRAPQPSHTPLRDPFCSQASHVRGGEGQKAATGFGTKSCCQAPNQDQSPNARPTGDPACLMHRVGTSGEAERGEAVRAGRQAGRQQREQARPHCSGAAQRARGLPWEENPAARQGLSLETARCMRAAAFGGGVSLSCRALLQLRKNSELLSCNLLQQSDTNQ